MEITTSVVTDNKICKLTSECSNGCCYEGQCFDFKYDKCSIEVYRQNGYYCEYNFQCENQCCISNGCTDSLTGCGRDLTPYLVPLIILGILGVFVIGALFLAACIKLKKSRQNEKETIVQPYKKILDDDDGGLNSVSIRNKETFKTAREGSINDVEMDTMMNNYLPKSSNE